MEKFKYISPSQDSVNRNETNTQLDNIGHDVENVTKQFNSSTRRISPLKAVVTFTDDDGVAKVYTKLKPLFDSKGITGSVSIISNKVDVWLTQSQLLEMQNSGWEIISHTVTHRNLTTITNQEIVTELRDSKSQLESFGFKIRSLMYPNGAHNAFIQETAKEYYESAGISWDVVNTCPINSFRIKRVPVGNYTVNGANTDTLDYYKAQVDYAIANNGWVVFMTHIDAISDVQFGYLGELIDYVKSLNVSIMNYSDAYDLFKNNLEIGEVYKGGVTSPGQAFDGSIPTPYLAISPDGVIYTNQTTLKSTPSIDSWGTPTLLGAWLNYDANSTVQYMKDKLGFVHLRGGLKAGTANTSAFTLPVGYRPSATSYYVGYCDQTNDGRIFVLSDGSVYIKAYTNQVFLDGITFQAI